MLQWDAQPYKWISQNVKYLLKLMWPIRLRLNIQLSMPLSMYGLMRLNMCWVLGNVCHHHQRAQQTRVDIIYQHSQS